MRSIAPLNQSWLKVLRQSPLPMAIVGHLLRIHLINPIDAEALRGTVR